MINWIVRRRVLKTLGRQSPVSVAVVSLTPIPMVMALWIVVTGVPMTARRPNPVYVAVASKKPM